MARYIDADVPKRNIRVNLMSNVDVDGTVTVENAERYFLNLIEKTTTADVVEVKHGEWIVVGRTKGMSAILKCSYCGRVRKGHGRSNYCPDCGAKMDGGNE